jgi:hypothetical protein
MDMFFGSLWIIVGVLPGLCEVCFGKNNRVSSAFGRVDDSYVVHLGNG